MNFINDDTSFPMNITAQEDLGATPSGYPNVLLGLSCGHTPTCTPRAENTRATFVLKRKPDFDTQHLHAITPIGLRIP